MTNEEAWDNIYRFIRKELGNTEDDSDSVQEPAADYMTTDFRYLGYTETEAFEYMKDYEENDGYPLYLSDEEWEEIIQADEECDEHPEMQIPFDVVIAELNKKYGI